MAIQQLTLTQNQVAQQIVAAGQYMGATESEIIGALSAAWAESRLNPNAVGDSGKAVGVFQQHPHYGSAEARRDPLTAARQFFTNLFGTRPSGEPIAERVADVQRPAAKYRGIYGDSLDEAYAIYTQVRSETAPRATGSPDSMERSLLLRTWRDVDTWLESLGITVGAPTTGQTTGGSHAPGSYHYSGTARDYGQASDRDAIARALVPLAVGPNRQIDELYYAPLGIFYDNGVPLSNPSASLVAGHKDHVHVALTKGGSGGAINLGSMSNIASTGAAQTTGGSVLKVLDGVLNDSGGILDPIGTGKIVVARGAIVLGGLICVTFGFVLVVTSIGKPAAKVAGAVTNPVGAVTGAVTS